MSMIKTLLKELAGDLTYQRGENYYRDGHVTSIYLKQDKIYARVQGDQSYRIELDLNAGQFDCYCDCPAFAREYICKHCIAATLAYEDKKHSGELENNPYQTEKETITSYLKSKDQPQLINIILSFIEQDDQLWQQWLAKASSALGSFDYQQMVHFIDEMLPASEHYNYRDTAIYFDHAEKMFETLEEQFAEIPEQDFFNLMQYAFKRLNQALDYLDDSGGYSYSIIDSLSTYLTDSFLEIDWSSEKKADFLFKQLGNELDIYPYIPEGFIGKRGNLETEKLFYQKVEDKWQELSSKQKQDNYTFSSLLKKRATKRNNTDKLLQLEIETATHGHSYVDICRLYIRKKDFGNAKIWLEKIKGSSTSNIYLPACVEFYLAENKSAQALEYQWQYFQYDGHFQQYLKLLEILPNTDQIEKDYQQKAEQFLLKNLKPASYRHHNTAANTLIDLYLYYEELNLAAAIAIQYSTDKNQTLKIGKLLLRDNQVEKGVNLYQKVIFQIAGQTNNKAYSEAVSLLYSLQKSMNKAPLNEHYELFTILLTNIRKQLKPKRNLMALLDKTFGVDPK